MSCLSNFRFFNCLSSTILTALKESNYHLFHKFDSIWLEWVHLTFSIALGAVWVFADKSSSCFLLEIYMGYSPTTSYLFNRWLLEVSRWVRSLMTWCKGWHVIVFISLKSHGIPRLLYYFILYCHKSLLWSAIVCKGLLYSMLLRLV